MIGGILVTGKTDEEFNENLKKATNKWFKNVVVGDIFIDNEGKKCVLVKYVKNKILVMYKEGPVTSFTLK